MMCGEYKIVSDLWYQEIYKQFCDDSSCEMRLIWSKEFNKQGLFNLNGQGR
jgi:hypothetical protein